MLDVGRCAMKYRLIFPILLAFGLTAAEPPRKVVVFLAGSEPERISGEAIVGEKRGALELTRSAPSYDIESMQTFARQCPGITMTTRRDKVDVIVRIEREGPNPTTPFVKNNKIAVFNLDDELVYSTRARLLGNAGKDACGAIMKYVKK
jgi:hypothetical protein